jgi:predicted DNA-binding transcriptional regulator AlpA
VIPAVDLAAQLRDLADRVADLEPARVVGELEALKFSVWTTAAAPAPNGAGAYPISDALDVDAVAARSGMSKSWLYRQARAGHLPFARRIGRRIVFDEAGLRRWMDRRQPG